MSQRWQATGNTEYDLTGPRFEPKTSRSRDERASNKTITALAYEQLLIVCEVSILCLTS